MVATKHLIDRFNIEYFFLSNFYPSPVTHRDIVYPTVEHAFQAAKTTSVGERETIAALATPGEAKRAGARVTLRAGWDTHRNRVMLYFLRRKFRDASLRNRLLETDRAQLVEGNKHGDQYWGVCNGRGANHLGLLLMQVREECRGPTV